MTGVPVELDAARSWVEESLVSGTLLAKAIGDRLDAFDMALLLVPQIPALPRPQQFDQVGRGYSLDDSVRVAKLAFKKLQRPGCILVVEDDLALRGDPGADIGTVFIGDRVLRTHSRVADNPAGAAELLRSGASGYPTNAYVCSSDGADLLLGREGKDVHDIKVIAKTVSAVIVSVFDAETFVLLGQSADWHVSMYRDPTETA